MTQSFLDNPDNDSHLRLSLTTGFLTDSPSHGLPEPFQAWDQIAAELPALVARRGLTEAARSIPFLDPTLMEGHSLQRAASISGLFIHALVNLEKVPFESLPVAVVEFWKGVCRALGRHSAYLAYTDLITCNWASLTDDPARTVENMKVLIPVAGNQEERVFYLTQVEILYRSRALLASCLRIARSWDSDERLEQELLGIRAVTDEIREGTLSKIQLRPGAVHPFDPVVWARTVAPVAVPIQPNQPGASGTANPYFHVMDTLLGRRAFSTFLGKECQIARQSYPHTWRTFLHFVEGLSLSERVAHSQSKSLKHAYSQLFLAYAGPTGLLQAHRRKATAILEVAFKVGRQVTIGGFRGDFHDKEWLKVESAFRQAIAERHQEVSMADERKTASVPYSELASHHAGSSDPWIAIHGNVYRLSPWLDQHPGGRHLLLLHAGLDATTEFERQHPDAQYLRFIEKELVGPLEKAPHCWRRGLLDTLTEIENVAVVERESLTKPHFPLAGEAQAPFLDSRAEAATERLQTTLRRYFDGLAASSSGEAAAFASATLRQLQGDAVDSLGFLRRVRLEVGTGLTHSEGARAS